jgi:hypothetical protein
MQCFIGFGQVRMRRRFIPTRKALTISFSCGFLAEVIHEGICVADLCGNSARVGMKRTTPLSFGLLVR